MFPARLAIHDHAEIVLEITALAGDVDAAFPRRLRYPLPLVASWLRVLLERDGPPGLQPVDVLVCDLVTRQVIVACCVAARHRIARRVRARSEDFARVDQLGERENVLRPDRGIEIARHAEGEIDAGLGV